MGASCSCLFGERSRLEILSQVQEEGADNSQSVADNVEVGAAKYEVVADSKREVVVKSEKDTSVPVTPAITAVPVSSPVKATASPSAPPTTAKDTADAPAIQPAKTAAVPTPAVAPPCVEYAQKDEKVAAHNGKQVQERPADVTTAAGDVQEEEEDNDVEQEVHTSGKKKRRRRKKKGGSNGSEVSGSHVDNKQAQASAGNKSKTQGGQVGAGNKKASAKATVK